jgi:hypothetical protein
MSKALERFLWGPVSATPLALLRIAVGLIGAAWALTLIPSIEPWLTVPGVAGPTSPILGRGSFLPAGSPPWLLGLLLAVTATAGAATALGWKTRISSWTLFLMLLAIQRHSPGILNGGDLILRLLALGVALSPAGAYLSVDAWRRGWSWQAPLVSAISLRFVQLHISLGYLLSAMLKLRGATWRDGTAIWYALQIDDLLRLRIDPGLISPPVTDLLSWATLGVEFLLGVGVWVGWLRPWALLGGVALHLGIAVVFEIGFFPWVMLASYLVFVRPVTDLRQLAFFRPWANRFGPVPALGHQARPVP